MRVLTTVEDVIAELGGVRAVAKLTKRKPNAVYNWVALRRCSAATYFVMATALSERGAIAPPRLWGMVGKLPQAVAA